MALESKTKAYASDEVRELFDARDKARLAYNTGIQVARQEGLEQGLQQGLQQGVEAGKLESARKMLEAGMPREQVEAILGVSIPQL